jgi:antitoxin component of MazEF toxin-antitoxin module
MIKQLRRVGNSRALILDRALIELLGLEENAEVELTVHNGSLIVTPANPKPVSPERFEQSLSRVVKRRRSALRRLAE